MLFGKRKRFVLNKNKMLIFCERWLDNYASLSDSFISSDKKDIIAYISSELDSSFEFISSLNEDDDWFEEDAIARISQASYNLLFDGKRDMGGLYTNPISYKSLWGVHTAALHWALQRNLITEEDIEEDRLAYLERRNERSHGYL